MTSAQEMFDAVIAHLPNTDIFIGTAAVADFRAEEIAPQKIKKQGQQANELLLRLVPNPDILATVSHKDPKPFTVGFAAETQNLVEYAQQKLISKNLDLIVANDVSRAGIGFNSDDNAVTLIWPKDSTYHKHSIEQASKAQVARAIIDAIGQRLGLHP